MILEKINLCRGLKAGREEQGSRREDLRSRSCESRELARSSKPVSYTHLDVYKRQGKTVDFKNTILIMTSNIGSQYLVDGIDEAGQIRSEAEQMVMQELRAHFRPEFLNRLDETILFKMHSLGEWRVNGALPQIGAWYEAFNVTEKDPMFLPVEKRVSIW